MRKTSIYGHANSVYGSLSHKIGPNTFIIAIPKHNVVEKSNPADFTT